MQNQKKIKISNYGMRMAGFLLILFCIAAFLIPAKALFTGNGYFAQYIHMTAAIKMYIEIAVLAVLIFGGMTIVKSGKTRSYCLLAIVLVFSWIHVVFLPMVISAAYLLSVMIIGRFLRKYIFFRKKDDVFKKCETYRYFLTYMNFLFGASFAIVLYCILSAFGIGKIWLMRVIIYGFAAFLLAFDYWDILSQLSIWKKKIIWMLDGRKVVSYHESIVRERNADCLLSVRTRFALMLALGWCVLMFLIQAGRLNIALDYDTLWYGVRSEYIVAGGTGLYDNPGLVGMVYVYSKGFEVLTLPLCNMASHSYLTFFNLWTALLGIGAMIWNAKLLTEDITQNEKFSLAKSGKIPAFRRALPGLMAAVFTISVPGIMNMAITAKSDLVTWLLQLIMLGCFFQYLHVSENRVNKNQASENRAYVNQAYKNQVYKNQVDEKLACEKQNEKESTKDGWMFLAGTVGSYLLSLTMKPTSLVFSTAVFGMMGLYLIWFLLHERAAMANLIRSLHRIFMSICLPLTALIGIWARTMIITGMPVTSVFTTIFELFGFEMKYPFATSKLPENYQEESTIYVLLRRLWQMLIQPEGEDMGHVVIAWGTSLMAVFIVLMIIYAVFSKSDSHKIIKKSRIWNAFKIIFVPFIIVCAVSLTMLYQIDGNYFELLYSMLILVAIRAMAYFEKVGFGKLVLKCLVPLLLLNLLITAVSNWAWTLGFSEIRLVNNGRCNHRAKEQMRMEQNGNVIIWQMLSKNPQTRVISFGTHPYCLQFPCNVESYNDITSPWGNVEIVNTPEAFEEYMAYAKTEYVYAEAGFMGSEETEWRLYLLRELIGRGSLTDLFFENGNMLARVSDTKISEEEAKANLEKFNQEYRFYTEEGENK